jgi:ADP-ribose pyrophosphatase YjhB (NUDIX family)
MNKKKFHLRVRAVIHEGENLLAVRMKGQNYCFLPGGRHEIGETLSRAIIREIKEELGLPAAIQRYLGIIENGWKENNSDVYEINHVFEVKIPKLKTNKYPRSKENKIEFFWLKPKDFARRNLLPVIIRPLIKKLFKGDKTTWIASNF